MAPPTLASLTPPAHRADLQWEEKTGRDIHGDRYFHYILVHSPSRRLLAKIIAPAETGQYEYWPLFYTAAADRVKADSWTGDSDVRFVELSGAKDYAEMMVKDFRVAK